MGGDSPRDKMEKEDEAISEAESKKEELPQWKEMYLRMYSRLFGWWERGVPPTWLVIVGCLVVQVE